MVIKKQIFDSINQKPLRKRTSYLYSYVKKKIRFPGELCIFFLINDERVLDIRNTENIRGSQRKRDVLRFSYKSPNLVLTENRDRIHCYYACFFFTIQNPLDKADDNEFLRVYFF